MSSGAADFPSLDTLGRDLLAVHTWRRAISLATPFLLTIGFFVFAAQGWLIASVVCTMLLTFFTYGSISHDLVHRTLRLPRAFNEALLCAIELMAFRSGHAYRFAHLNHHARFPAADDLEGAAAGMTWWRALWTASRFSRGSGCSPSARAGSFLDRRRGVRRPRAPDRVTHGDPLDDRTGELRRADDSRKLAFSAHHVIDPARSQRGNSPDADAALSRPNAVNRGARTPVSSRASPLSAGAASQLAGARAPARSIFCAGWGATVEALLLTQHDRGFLETSIGDGRSLLVLSAVVLMGSGAFAIFQATTGNFLPHDTAYLGMTASELCALHGCRILHFMIHDRISFGGVLVAIAVLYLWLALFPLRRRESWAWWALALSSVTGFLSFLSYLGYGYFDTWHGAATLALAPLFVVGLVRTRRLRRNAVAPAPLISVLVTASAARSCCCRASGSAAPGGDHDCRMTSVFVPQDFEYMGISRAAVSAINPRLVPLVATIARVSAAR